MQMRRSFPLGLAVTLCAVALSSLLLLVEGRADALDTPRYVATWGADTSACDDPNAPCATVQYAVDQADEGDIIRVAGGIYTGVQTRPVPPGYGGAPASGVLTQVVYLTGTIHIEGGYTAPGYAWPPDPEANPTTLDAQNQGRGVLLSGYGSPTLHGLRITGGDATGLGGDTFGNDVGGGVLIDRVPVGITATRVFSNSADGGGGIYVYDGELTLHYSDILSNSATNDAGGIHAHFSTVKLDGNRISANEGRLGGGLSIVYGDGDLTRNTISSNTAMGEGGGLRIVGSDVTLEANTIAGNRAGYGGGIGFFWADVELANNIVADNEADEGGAGLNIQASTVRLDHTTIADNLGGDGDGVYLIGFHSDFSVVTFTNSIVANHPVGIGVAADNTATLTATLWYGNLAETAGPGTVIDGGHNVNGYPAFIDSGIWDYHIGADSAAVDAGVAATTVAKDIDGEPRPMRDGYDLGADEVPWTAYLPLVLRK